MSKASIIMYHFVRDLQRSAYPAIKGLDTALFKEQLRYLQKHYHIIRMEELIDSVHHNTKLPEKACVLTFDDGYADHYDPVFSLLRKEGLQGSFYPPAKAILENKVLDVNKIHFILAANEDKKAIIQRLKEELSYYRESYRLESFEYYYSKLAKAYGYDGPEVIFIKRLLQVALPEDLRNIIAHKLFEEAVNMDEASFSKTLYLSMDQLQEMQREGMHIGSHGYDHYWFDAISPKQQEEEVVKSLEFLQQIGVPMDTWTMCYPYGAYNDSLLSILKKHNCQLALAAPADICNSQTDHPYIIPRLDTNDIPKDAAAPVNKWYELG